MKSHISLFELFHVLRQNWFRIAVALLVMYLFFQRDLSFQVQLNPPNSGAIGEQYQGASYVEEAKHPATSEKLGLLFSGSETTHNALASDLQKLEEYEVQSFIQRFMEVARVEQEKFGIPASVVLGTALYESTAGHRKISDIHTNNFFGLLCAEPEAYTPAWQGRCKKVDQLLLRQYQTAWESFRDFSYFAYRQFGKLSGEDYKVWLGALGRQLYGQDTGFAPSVINLVERHSLHDYDF